MDSSSAFVFGGILLILALGLCFDVFRPVNDKHLHSRYRKRRLMNWVPIGVTYAAYYMARYNIAAGNIESVRAALGLTKSSYGWIITSGFWCYAITAPFTGRITDTIGGKSALLIGTLGAASCNALLGLLFAVGSYKHALLQTISLYSLNVFFQGFGTAAAVKVNAAWYNSSERGVFAGIFNLLLTSGYFMALGMGSWIVSSLSWAWLFLVPAAVLAVSSIAIQWLVEDTPGNARIARDGSEVEEGETTSNPMRLPLSMRHKGFGAIGGGGAKRRSSDATAAADGYDDEGAPSIMSLLRNGVFVNYCCAIVFLSWVRDGLLNWLISFLTEVHAVSVESSSATLIGGAITFGGFAGGVLCGWISDNIFQGQRLPPCLLFTCGQIVSLIALYWISVDGEANALGASVLVMLACVFILGNYTLLSYTVPCDLGPRVAATGTGLMTAVGYISSGMSGVVMGTMIEKHGYWWWISSLVIASVLFALTLLVGMVLQRRARDGGRSSSPGKLLERAPLIKGLANYRKIDEHPMENVVVFTPHP